MSTTADRPQAVTDPNLDISSQEFWEQPFDEREKTFARLRAEMPVSYHRPYESTMQPPDEDTPGFWALTKYEDIRWVSQNAELLGSKQGFLMEDFPEVLQVGIASFLGMDDPEHAQLRGIVQKALTPPRVRKMEHWIEDRARTLLDGFIDKGEADYVDEFAELLAGHVFADFFGLPEEGDYRETVMDAAMKMLAWDDPEVQQGRSALETFGEEGQRIQDIALEIAEQRREDPRDDVVTWLVQAEFEGRKMEDWEIASFSTLIGSAGNDTTRHSLAHAAHLLTTHPDQRQLLVEDVEGRVDGAIEEVLRYSTPVQHFRRTAYQDVEIRGVEIKEGEKVVMWYCAGNYDEEMFEDPHKFDIQRENARRNLAFGGGGPHFCLGNALGRQMLKSGLTQIYSRIPDIETYDPQYQRNNFIHGVTSLQAKWTPPSKSQ